MAGKDEYAVIFVDICGRRAISLRPRLEKQGLSVISVTCRCARLVLVNITSTRGVVSISSFWREGSFVVFNRGIKSPLLFIILSAVYGVCTRVFPASFML